MKSLLKSRKFWVTLVTGVLCVLKPEWKESVLQVGGILVGAIALEDAATKVREPKPTLFPPEAKK